MREAPIQSKSTQKSPLSEKFSLVLPLLEQRILPKKAWGWFPGRAVRKIVKIPFLCGVSIRKSIVMGYLIHQLTWR
ncbi:MAG: hypothetical protein ACYCOU_08650, partial [Sulfobacillus sp.]